MIMVLRGTEFWLLTDREPNSASAEYATTFQRILHYLCIDPTIVDSMATLDLDLRYSH